MDKISIRENIDRLNAEENHLQNERNRISRETWEIQKNCDHDYDHKGRTTYPWFGKRLEIHKCRICDHDDWR